MVAAEKKKKIKEFDLSLPSYNMVENLEGLGQFEPVDEKLARVFYNLFRKEIRQTNESGSRNKSGRSNG